MPGRFEYFILLAEMRTGSNFLEESINAFPGLTCHGELFNPHFIGHADTTQLHGISLPQREANPVALLDRVRSSTPGMSGFRFFHDHDPRILAHCLPDPACAKIILTRNPIDSYVSLKIAGRTGQWRLKDLKNAKSARIDFDADEFLAHLDALQAFQLRLLYGLQTTGQTAFYIGYDDLGDTEVLNGMARFLGVPDRIDKPATQTKVQNPQPLSEKVTNFEDLSQVLARLDRFDLTRTPNFEPRRGPAVPAYVAAAGAPLLFQPVRAGVEARVTEWLGSLGDTPGLVGDFTQKTLRQWKRKAGQHRSFTVVRHPVPRLYSAFCRHILATGPGSYPEIRQTLRATYKLPIPENAPGEDFGPEEMRKAFLAFAAFVKGNLGGQTSIRVDPAWASQDALVQGLSQFALPDMVLRAESLDLGLDQLCAQVGVGPKPVPAEVEDRPVDLARVYDDEVEAAVRAAYQRDYMTFGYGRWRD